MLRQNSNLSKNSRLQTVLMVTSRLAFRVVRTATVKPLCAHPRRPDEASNPLGGFENTIINTVPKILLGD